MVDVVNPLSMHQALSSRQPMMGPGPFAHASHNPHMYGDPRNPNVLRASTTTRPATGSSYGQVTAVRNPTATAASQEEVDVFRPQAPLPHGGRVNDSTGSHAGGRPDLYPSSQSGNTMDMNIARLVQKETEHTLEQARTHSLSPSSQRSSQVPSEANGHRRQSSTGHSIVPYLQIPSTINDSKGSLAEFAAQITCLFWFESSYVLQRVEDAKDLPYPTMPLTSEAIPSLGFRKWVITILSTTQVTQNVILLALLFIYRLKKLNPTVKGKTGSEFRLLTVALMLGNKFLDDNTYTNKTWAEVSGISVQEIHIMEVEFLSNMRYSLYTSKEKWGEWQTKLGRFWTYFEKASRAPLDASSRLAGASAPVLKLPSALPSPPSSNHTSPPLVGTYSPHNAAPAFPHHIGQRPPSALPSPAASIPDLGVRTSANNRKRSYDDGSQEPAQKRVLRSTVNTSNLSRPSALTPLYAPGVAPSLPHLPAPTLSATTGASTAPFPAMASTQLPPPGGRAMSLVYTPQTAPGWLPGPVTPTNSGQTSNPVQTASIPAYDQLRRQSLHPSEPTGLSPTAGMGPGPILSQAHASPSYFLSNRNSPYRPVRGVSTLLVSPPSAAVQNAPHPLPLHQMHYHPLAKARTEYKTGVVPYMHHDTWSNMYQPQHWPQMPQPNFNA